MLGDWEFNIRLLMLGEIDFLDRDLAFYHQRDPGAAPGYGNTATDGLALHQRHTLLLRNSALRIALTREPALLGAVQAMLTSRQTPPPAPPQFLGPIEDRLAALEARQADLLRSQLEIARVASQIGRILQPVSSVWRGWLPLRHAIARLRGRG